nr:PREDICTED: uncharacterized protein LOC103356573 [Stegastes partitus]
MVPFKTVENERFKCLLKVVDPRYELPSRKYFSNTAIPRLYSECREKIERKVQNVQFFTTNDHGDPLKIWLMTPLTNPQTDQERRYNDAHSRTQSVMELAVGMLKGRWRCLDRTGGVLLYRPEKVCRIVMACGVLHNVAHRHAIPLPEQHIPPPDEPDAVLVDANPAREAIRARDAERLLHAFVSSRLDYCNALLIRIPGRSLQKLQYIQNCAARILTRRRKYDHFTPILWSRHWLTVRWRIETETVGAVETDSGKDVDPERGDVKGTETDEGDTQLLHAGMLVVKNMVKFQIDCGASCNVIPINLLNPDTKLEHTKSVLVMYNKSARGREFPWVQALVCLEECWVLEPRRNTQGKVLRPVDGKSYEVQLHSGGVIQRNCRHPRCAPGMSFSYPADMEISIPSQAEAVGHEHSDTVPPPPPRDTGDKDMPATTRAGRAVVQPQWNTIILKVHFLFAKPKKCEYHRTYVGFLGYVISRGQLEPDPAKIQAVTDWPTPTSWKDLQRFLEFSHFYRRFIQNYSQVAVPLTSLTSTMTAFRWSPEANTAFHALKALLRPSCDTLIPPSLLWLKLTHLTRELEWSYRSTIPCPRGWLSKSGDTGWRGLSSLLPFGLTIGTWPTCGQCSRNDKLDALSQGFSASHETQNPAPIIPEARTVDAASWEIEAVIQRALVDEPDPSDGPPNWLFVPAATWSQVLQWGHASKIVGSGSLGWPGTRGSMWQPVPSAPEGSPLIAPLQGYSTHCWSPAVLAVYYVPLSELPSALETAELLTEHVRLHGIPSNIVLDWGPQFASQTNGQKERANQDLDLDSLKIHSTFHMSFLKPVDSSDLCPPAKPPPPPRIIDNSPAFMVSRILDFRPRG